MVHDLQRSQPVTQQTPNTLSASASKYTGNRTSRIISAVQSMRQPDISNHLKDLKIGYQYKDPTTAQKIRDLSEFIASQGKSNQKKAKSQLDALEVLSAWISEAPTLELEQARRQSALSLVKEAQCIYSNNRLKLNGSLKMTEFHHYELPDNMEITGSLVIKNPLCTHIPDNLSVGQNLEASQSNIYHIGSNLKVELDLNLKESKVTVFPATATVGRHLNLASSQLHELPDSLSIRGNLNLYATRITRLPTYLKVGGQLIAGLTDITKIPDLKNVHGDLFFQKCAQLKDFPDSILKLGRKHDFQFRKFMLTDTGIPESRLEQLPISASGGTHFIIHSNIHHWRKFVSLEAAVKSWSTLQTPLTHIRPERWGLDELEAEELNSFLAKLHSTKEATNNSTRAQFVSRIQDFIEHFDQSIQNSNRKASQYKAFDFHDDAITRIRNANGSCHDGANLILMQMDSDLKVDGAFHSSRPEHELKKLAIPFLAMAEIENAATELYEKHASNEDPKKHLDEVEVILFYMLSMKNVFKLPIENKIMDYSAFIVKRFNDLDIKIDDELFALKNRVNSRIKNPQEIELFEKRWPPLVKFYRLQDIKKMKWDKLEKTKVSFAPDDCCVYTSEELRKMSKPVEVKGQLYELDAFARVWIKNGNDPFTRMKVSAKDFHQVPKPKRQ